MSVELNQPFPDFNLPDANGVQVDKASLLGKPTILYFYPKDDTSGCTLEAKDFSLLIAEDPSVNVIGISPDSITSHAKFIKKYELSVRLLADEQHEFAERLGIWVEKSMYGKKYMGIERTTYLLDSKGVLVKVWNKVKVPGHAEEVLALAKTVG